VSALKALLVASGLYPLKKTSGLANVAGALPNALAGKGIQ
jgi:starch synthase